MARIVAMMDSGFDYYAPQSLQSSIDTQNLVEVQPSNTITSSGPIDFTYTGADISRQYLDLAGSYFSFKVRARKLKDNAPDENPLATDEISCVQNLAHSMFRRIEVSLNDTPITDPNLFYPYRAYIQDLLSQNTEAQKFWMPMQGWTKRDAPGKFDSWRTSDGNTPGDAAKERNELLGTGKFVQLIMRPHVEGFNLGRFIPPGVKVKVEFTPTASDFVLKRGTGDARVRFEIAEALFHLHVINATHSQHLAVLSALSKLGNLKFNMTRTRIITKTIGAGSSNAPTEPLFAGQLPNRIILGMVSDDAQKGGLALNPFNFKPFGVNSLSLTVNGVNHPTKEFKPDWDNGLYKREYMATITALNKGFSSDAVNITLNEFKDGYTLFAFDLTPDKNNPGSISDLGTGHVYLNLTLATATTSAIQVLVFAEWDSLLEIDQARNVLMHK